MTIEIATGTLQTPVIPPPAFVGLSGGIYGFVGGPIQNAGSPNYFQPITSAGHQPVGMDSVTTTTGSTGTITISYASLNAIDIVTFIIVPDETFVINGVSAGASVGLTQAIINTAKNNVQTDPSLLNTTTYPNSNFWVWGVFRTG